MQYALMAGDNETGVTTMMMDAGLDTGDILLQASLPLEEIENLAALEPRLAEIGADLLIQTLETLRLGDCPRVPQEEGGVTLAPSLSPEIGQLDWNRPARDLHNLVRGVTPKPGAYTFWQGKRLKVWRTEVVDGVESVREEIGTIENVGAGGITVVTSEGALRLLDVQPESKGRMAADAWARGARVNAGQAVE